MTKRNRKMKKHTIFTAGSMGIVVLIVTGFIMLMAYWSLDSRCSSISREIGKAEKRYEALEAECVQEMAHWDAMKTPEKLSEKLLRFGLEMKYARQDQIVRMNADGRPVAGQISVARARQRIRTSTIAMQSEGLSAKSARIRPSVATVPSRATAVRR